MAQASHDQPQGWAVLVGLPASLRTRLEQEFAPYNIRVHATPLVTDPVDWPEATTIRLVVAADDEKWPVRMLCRCIRLLTILSPILVCRRNLSGDLCDLHAAGADLVIPIDPPVRVCAYARRWLEPLVEPRRYASIFCDLLSQSVIIEDRSIRLTGPQRTLLWRLMREPTTVVSWQALAFDVLGRPPNEAARRALYQSFWRLKKKLGNAGTWLRVHHGVGYLLSAEE